MENFIAVKLEKRVYSVSEAAEVLGISRSKMYEYVKSNGFPVLNIGRRILIPIKALDCWLEAQTAAFERRLS